MKRALAIAFAVVTLWTEVGLAVEFPAQARLFVGVTSADPTNLNQELQAQGLKDFKTIPKAGVEITYPVFSFLEVGLNYTKRNLSRDESDTNYTTEYQATLNQDAVQLIARVPVIKTSFFRVDAFGGIGGSNTTMSIKSASQDGELAKKAAEGWFSTPISSYGVSAAVGYKNFFLVLEGGFESNKVDSFASTGNLNGNIQTIDLSGSYATIGLLFDGITARTK